MIASTLIADVAALLMLTSVATAEAAEIPKQYRGLWCDGHNYVAPPPEPPSYLQSLTPEQRKAYEEKLSPEQLQELRQIEQSQLAQPSIPRSRPTPPKPFNYRRCKEADSESYLYIRRDALNLGEEDSPADNCQVNAIKPIAKGHRLYVSCDDDPHDVDLRLNPKTGRLTLH
jgi:hypothetical protein